MKSYRILSVLALVGAAAYGQTVSTVINGADGTPAACPGMVILVRGANLAADSTSSPGLPNPTSLGGVYVTFTDSSGASSPLPLSYVTPGEIRAQLPYDVALGAGTISVNDLPTATFGVTLTALAPRFITNFDGVGDLVMFHSSPDRAVTRADPARPGETVNIYLHGMGQTNPPAVAGADPGFSPALVVQQTVTATFDKLPIRVNSASLLGGNPGVYQVNITLPYDDFYGTLPFTLSQGDVSAQSGGVVPFVPNGFYYEILANSSPVQLSLNGISGFSSALATRQNVLDFWGPNGFNAWTKETGLPDLFEPIRGVAISLQSNGSIVYANNGIERGDGSFYNNKGGGDDRLAPGLLTTYSMSNHFDFVAGGFFRLGQATTFDAIMGYFDGNGDKNLPFDPASPFIKYRMNIFSNVPSSLNSPRETGSFRGDVWSSDTASGTWSWSYTGVDRIFNTTPTLVSDPTRRDDPIFRLVYKLDKPVTLPAGDYWFNHDATVPVVGAYGFTSASSVNSTLKHGATFEGRAEDLRPRPPALLRILP